MYRVQVVSLALDFGLAGQSHCFTLKRCVCLFFTVGGMVVEA